MLTAQDIVRLANCLVHRAWAGRLDVDRIDDLARAGRRAAAATGQLGEGGGDRHVNLVIERAEAVAALRLHHPNHLEALPVEPDRLPDRIGTGEERGRDRRAENDDRLVARHIAVLDEGAIDWIIGVDIREGGPDADRRAEGILAIRGDLPTATHLGGDGTAVRALGRICERIGVRERQGARLVAGGDAGGGLVGALNSDQVRTIALQRRERLGDDAVAVGQQGDDRGDADDDAEHGQDGAGDVRTEAVDGGGEALREGDAAAFADRRGGTEAADPGAIRRERLILLGDRRLGNRLESLLPWCLLMPWLALSGTARRPAAPILPLRSADAPPARPRQGSRRGYE